MKKILALIAAILFLQGMTTASQAEGAIIEISDIAGLMAMAENPTGSYRLTRDLDLAGMDWVPISFAGEFDGGGHTIYNLRVEQPGPATRTTRDGNLKEYDTVFAGLFATLENAVIHDLNLVGAYIGIESDRHCFAAILTGYMDHTTIRDVSVDGRVWLVNHAVMTGTGGMAGFGCGAFERCRIKCELVFEDRNFDKKCEQFLGGVLSCGICSILDCSVDIDAYDSCHGYVHNGGLMGLYYHCGMNYKKGPVNRCVIAGRIYFFEDNRDRRAYCRPGIGEHLQKPTQRVGNKAGGFKKKETRKVDKVLLPETCENPEYTLTVTDSTMDSWGYTVHTCKGCGYTWTDTYTPPAGRAE